MHQHVQIRKLHEECNFSSAYQVTLWYMFYLCFAVGGFVGFWIYLKSWTAAHATPWTRHLQTITNKTWPGFLLALRFSQMQENATRRLPQLSHLVLQDKTRQNNQPRNQFPSCTSDMDAIDAKWRELFPQVLQGLYHFVIGESSFG